MIDKRENGEGGGGVKSPNVNRQRRTISTDCGELETIPPPFSFSNV